MLPTFGPSRRSGTSLFPLALLASLSTLGAAGCNPQDFEEFLGDVRDSTSPPSGSSVPFEEFSDDPGARAATETRVLIRTPQGYWDYFGHAPPAGVDLGREWVIFYSAGITAKAGDDTNVLSLTSVGKTLIAVTQLVSTQSMCPVSGGLPYVLIKFAAQPGTTIEFNKRDSFSTCGPPVTPCAAILCAAGTHCQTQEVVCVRAPCPPIAVCVPDSEVRCGGIAGISCPDNLTCVDDPSDSCDPNAGGADCGGICRCINNGACVAGTVFDSTPSVCKCVPTTPPPPPAVVHCGGIAGIPCPGMGRCADDLSDSCDPNAGGADCGGVCSCVQNVLCVRGAVFDSSPAVCACVPQTPPPACGPVCTIFCQYGNVLDAAGCPTCACNPAPAP